MRAKIADEDYNFCPIAVIPKPSMPFPTLRRCFPGCRGRAWILVAVSALRISSYSVAQNTPANKPKLTPQQQQGLRLLQAAQAEAAGLQPDIRAFVLWQALRGYAAFDRAKANKLLRDAFVATFSIVKFFERPGG